MKILMIVKDNETGNTEKVISKTKNSYLVTRTKLTAEGINCDQWFTEKEFHKKFKIIEDLTAPTGSWE